MGNLRLVVGELCLSWSPIRGPAAQPTYRCTTVRHSSTFAVKESSGAEYRSSCVDGLATRFVDHVTTLPVLFPYLDYVTQRQHFKCLIPLCLIKFQIRIKPSI